MLTMQYVTTLFGGSLAAGARVTDFALLDTVTGPMLYAGAQPGMGLLSFSLGAGRAAGFSSAFQYPAGADSFGPTRLDILGTPDATVLLAPGRFAAELGGPALSPTGSFAPSVTFPDGSGPGGSLTDLETVRIGTDTWIYGTYAGSAGVAAWKLSAGASVLQQMPGLADDAITQLADISAIRAFRTGDGQPWLLVASTSEDAVTALSVGPDGGLTAVGSIGAADGLGLDAPAVIREVALGGAAYVIVAGGGSSSLSVLRLDPTGLTPTDHVTDTLDTRFQGVRALDAVHLDGRAWVFAGGIDDGISVFQLLGDGRLVLAATLADTDALPLADVAAIRAVILGGAVQVFVSSATENGIAQFLFTPGPPGQSLDGTPGNDTLAGTAAEDVILGRGGDDALAGLGGDDVLADGAGADTLTGGAGRDLFVLSPDGTADTVADFDPASDRLDLSFLPLLYSLSQISVAPTATGAVLTYGDETVVIVTANGAPLMPADLSTPMVLNLPRSPVQLILDGTVTGGTPGADTLRGTLFADSLSGGDGADFLSGGLSDDRLDGGTGGDTLDGGPGTDLAVYAAAAAGVTLDFNQPARNTGEALGDVLVSIEGAIGSAFADMLQGDGADNIFSGAAGGDSLSGRGGADTLDGGAGDDTLVGGTGADVLAGGPGTDTADHSGAGQAVAVDLALGAGMAGEANGDRLTGIENLTGSAWNDRLTGDGGANLLTGLAGSDTLAGGSGNDTLAGGVGADRLDGGAGFDSADYADAPQGVVADLVTPANGTGWAAGDAFAGIEALAGSAYADDLRGDAGANLISGGLSADWLMGRGGNDTLAGGDGNDNLIGGAGADLLDGGTGIDRASYSDATAGLVADLLSPWANTGIAAGDIYVSVEGFRGTNYDDTLAGDDEANQIDAGFGNDRMVGRGGADWLVGRAGADTLDGGDGNDVLFGGPGADVFLGGAGLDRANYGDSAAGLVADLLDPSRNTGLAAGDSYAGIENLQGSPAPDDLGGDAGDNMLNGARGDDRLSGRAGADFLVGAEGNDTLWGGAGGDLLHGGAGQDVFAFGRGDGYDRVLDLVPGQDRLSLSSSLPQIAGLSAGDIVLRFGAGDGTDSWLDFGGGDRLLIRGIADPGLLAGDIVLG